MRFSTRIMTANNRNSILFQDTDGGVVLELNATDGTAEAHSPEILAILEKVFEAGYRQLPEDLDRCGLLQFQAANRLTGFYIHDGWNETYGDINTGLLGRGRWMAAPITEAANRVYLAGIHAGNAARRKIVEELPDGPDAGSGMRV